MEVTLTAASLDWFAQRTAGEIASAITVIAVGSGTPSGSGLGAEIADSGFARGAGTATGVYTSPGTLTVSKTFTATADKTISEAALYSTDSTPVLIGYVHFGSADLSNGGEVPIGEPITITFVLTLTQSTFTRSVSSATNITYIGSIVITIAASGTITPGSFTCIRHGVCFNGRKITNCNIVSAPETRGGRVWDFTGYTEDYTDIEHLNAYAGPCEIGKTILGKQYVNSVLLPGTLRIWNTTTHTHDVYTYCWINGDIAVAEFGNGWFFGLQVVQSYEGVV